MRKERKDSKILSRKLREMRLPAMADTFDMLVNDVTFPNMNPLDVVETLIESEYNQRNDNTIERRLKAAHLSDKMARLENIDYDPERKLNKDVIQILSTGEYIERHYNCLILGATGTGKSFIANGLAVSACYLKYKVIYVGFYDLLGDYDLDNARGSHKYFDKYAKTDLLVIDDFLLSTINEAQTVWLFRLLGARLERRSTIIGSQLAPEEWYTRLGSGALAEAILDRITNNAYKIIIQGDSQRSKRAEVKN